MIQTSLTSPTSRLAHLIRDRQLRGELIPVHELPNLIPSCRKGKKLALATVYRWILKGRLPTLRIGGGRFVTAAALAQFIQTPCSQAMITDPVDTARKAGRNWIG